MDPDAMSPCFKGCGAWVKTSGPAICNACQVGPAKEDPSLHTTDRALGPFTVRTRGYSVVLTSVLAPQTMADYGMFADQAHALSVALQQAADYVKAMTSPYEAPKHVPTRSVGVVDDPYGHEEDEQ